MPADDPDDQFRLVAALRRYGAVHAELMRSFAAYSAMHPTDAAALTEILFAEDAGEPLTPVLVAARVGRSKAAMSAVLNRLESAQMIRRQPHPRDRRAMTLHAGPAIDESIREYFAPLSNAMSAFLANRSAQDIDRLVEDLDQISEVISGTLAKI